MQNARAAFVAPMLCAAVAKLPEGPSWQYEIKFDGYRTLTVKTADRVQLRSRNDNDFTSRFSSVAAALRDLPNDTVLDGEVVALDESGRPSFSVLQHHRSGRPLLYYVFDLLILHGRDLRQERLAVRRRLLETDVLPRLGDPIRYSAPLSAGLAQVIDAAREQGLEGIIAKRTDSRYESGDRSGAWLKMRINKGQELVVGGYRMGPNFFDNLAVGYYAPDCRLLFIAKIKNGFTPRLRKQVFERFAGLATSVCPFSNLPNQKAPAVAKP